MSSDDTTQRTHSDLLTLRKLNWTGPFTGSGCVCEGGIKSIKLKDKVAKEPFLFSALWLFTSKKLDLSLKYMTSCLK